MFLRGYGNTIIRDMGLRWFREPSAEVTHVASNAVEGIEVRIHEETHDNSNRSRCTISISGVRGSGLRPDNEYYNDDHHVNDFKQHERLKWAPRAVSRISARYAESQQESDRLSRPGS